jgi:hypothetical protein
MAAVATLVAYEAFPPDSESVVGLNSDKCHRQTAGGKADLTASAIQLSRRNKSRAYKEPVDRLTNDDESYRNRSAAQPHILHPASFTDKRFPQALGLPLTAEDSRQRHYSVRSASVAPAAALAIA